ncbi:MAG: [FeFe] hydrogenase H-cluster maturation GTPase HydF, partial [Acidobacteria bacterium]|nr:[FeFe] hydrogenase H-cluster maturation GTPase HydF [Acidobacteriota bacterium]
MSRTPTGMRIHIGIFGRRNAGKSSLLNALTRQAVSIVSPTAGTTTDPVNKPMELLPLGPVLFVDTAGIDDVGALGEWRVRRTRAVMDRTDLALVVAPGDEWGEFEEGLVTEFRQRGTPLVVVFNRCDVARPATELLASLAERGIATVQTVATTGEGVLDLREALPRTAPAEWVQPQSIVGDLLEPGELVVLVTPIDKEAPKERLILPQVQTIRDILDTDAVCLVVKEHQLRDALAGLKHPPALVVTDSQAFRQVSAYTPPDVPLTSFSILFARLKGDMDEFEHGARSIATLVPNDRVLVAETC